MILNISSYAVGDRKVTYNGDSKVLVTIWHTSHYFPITSGNWEN